jgi:hypothetical protein
MSWFSRPFGALALLNLDASEPFEDCPAGQLYIVETVVEELIPFVRSTMIAAGWAAESKGGYTLHGLFQRQLSHLKWIRKQGELEVDALLPHAQATFLTALLDCDSAHARMLSHPEPASAKLDFLIPFGGHVNGFEVLGAELPIAVARSTPMRLLEHWAEMAFSLSAAACTFMIGRYGEAGPRLGVCLLFCLLPFERRPGGRVTARRVG